MGYILKESGMQCELFFMNVAKQIKTDRLKGYLLVAKLRLCGKYSTMSQLASKAMSMSHIPEDYYQ